MNTPDYKILLSSTPLDAPLYYVKETISTMIDAENLYVETKMNGISVCAGFQTQGRGQQNHVWKSEQDKNLLLSFCISNTNNSLLSFRIALAVRQFLLLYQIDVLIKWPNDIFIHDKKLGGILIINKGNYYIIGLGINFLESPNPPYSISLLELGLDLKPLDKIEELMAFIKEFLYFLSDQEIIALLNKNLYKLNTVVTLTTPHLSFRGLLKGVNDKGYIMIGDEVFSTGSLSF